MQLHEVRCLHFYAGHCGKGKGQSLTASRVDRMTWAYGFAIITRENTFARVQLELLVLLHRNAWLWFVETKVGAIDLETEIFQCIPPGCINAIVLRKFISDIVWRNSNKSISNPVFLSNPSDRYHAKTFDRVLTMWASPRRSLDARLSQCKMMGMAVFFPSTMYQISISATGYRHTVKRPQWQDHIPGSCWLFSALTAHNPRAKHPTASIFRNCFASWVNRQFASRKWCTRSARLSSQFYPDFSRTSRVWCPRRCPRTGSRLSSLLFPSSALFGEFVPNAFFSGKFSETMPLTT